MDALQDLFVQSDVSRSIVDERLGTLAEAVDGLVRRMQPGADTAVLERIALGQEQMLAVMAERGEESSGAHVDAESRMRLRSIDVQLLRILEEMAAGRQESLADLRSDLSTVNKSVRALLSEVAVGEDTRG